MGYSVYITRSSAQIKRENFGEIRKIWIDMDKNLHEEKRGWGSASNERWFSWMNNWKPTEDTVVSTLEKLGFTVGDDENNDYISIDDYCSKSGQEDIFFDEIKEYVTGLIKWHGEDGDSYIWRFKDGRKR